MLKLILTTILFFINLEIIFGKSDSDEKRNKYKYGEYISS